MSEVWDSATHPKKEHSNNVWVNIGTECGGWAVLTMGVGEPDKDGFYRGGYTGFDMETADGIDDVISMLKDAKALLISYRKEIWDDHEQVLGYRPEGENGEAAPTSDDDGGEDGQVEHER
jgi:hypothetical protein